MSNSRDSGVLACAVAAALGSVGTAEATTYTAVLKQVASYSGNGSSAGNINSSTATWSYDDVTSQLTSTGGTFNVRFTITPTTTLFRHSIAGLVIGNGGAATATAYSCAEGNFGPNVGASLCGNYNFGANQINESTAVWGPGVTFNRTVGGDDMALGPQQNVDAYSYFATISWVGTTLTLQNASCNPSAPGNANGCATTGGFNTGYTWTLEAGPQATPPDINDDAATAESGVATGIGVLANDSGLTGSIAVTIVTPPTNGTAVVNGDNTITYTSNGGFTGSDPFTYNVVADNLPNPGLNGTVTVTVVDTVPDAFGFVSLSSQPLGAQVQSNAITITGISQPVAVSVANGAYSLGCTGTFTSAAGTINNNDQVCVRQTTAATPSTPTTTTLTVGGATGTFTVTTAPSDTSPDAFSFTGLTNVAPSTAFVSNTVTISGITAPSPISVAGGEYSIGCSGVFTNVADTISDGQTVCVRLVSSAASGTASSATLTVGGVSSAFTVTTAVSGPVAVDDQVTVEAGVPAVISVLANDTGFTFPKTVEIFTNPQHGTVQVLGSGAFSDPVITYTAAAGFQGVDTFAYLIQSSTGTDTALVTVNVIVDADGDGVYDNVDNCLGAPNPDQRDGDNDGYGTWCDADFNNDGRVNFADLSAFRTKFGTNDATADFNGDGVVNLLDLGRFKALFGGTPGPSGGNP